MIRVAPGNLGLSDMVPDYYAIADMFGHNYETAYQFVMGKPSAIKGRDAAIGALGDFSKFDSADRSERREARRAKRVGQEPAGTQGTDAGPTLIFPNLLHSPSLSAPMVDRLNKVDASGRNPWSRISPPRSNGSARRSAGRAATRRLRRRWRRRASTGCAPRNRPAISPKACTAIARSFVAALRADGAIRSALLGSQGSSVTMAMSWRGSAISNRSIPRPSG